MGVQFAIPNGLLREGLPEGQHWNKDLKRVKEGLWISSRGNSKYKAWRLIRERGRKWVLERSDGGREQGREEKIGAFASHFLKMFLIFSIP